MKLLSSRVILFVLVLLSLVSVANAIPENTIDIKSKLTELPELDMTGLYSDLDLIEVDPEIINVTPDWIVLAHDDEGKTSLLHDIDSSSLSDAEKSDMKKSVRMLWDTYPTKFEAAGQKSIEIAVQSDGSNQTRSVPIGHITRISFDYGKIRQAAQGKNTSQAMKLMTAGSPSSPIVLTGSENETITKITNFRARKISDNEVTQEDPSPDSGGFVQGSSPGYPASPKTDERITILGPGLIAWPGFLEPYATIPLDRYFGHNAIIYWACVNREYRQPATAGAAGSDPDTWSPTNLPRIPPYPQHPMFLIPYLDLGSYYTDIVHSYDHYYNPDENRFPGNAFPGNAPLYADDYARISRDKYTANPNDPDAAVTLGWSSHFLTDVSNPMHTGKEYEQIWDKLYSPYFTHGQYEDFVFTYSNHTVTYSDEFSGNSYTYNELSRNDEKMYYPITDPKVATQNLARFSHAYLDTLYYRVQNLPPKKDAGGHNIPGTGFQKDRTVIRITYNCIKAATRYTGGLVEFAMNKTPTAEIPIADFYASPNPVCGDNYEVKFTDKTHLTYRNTTDNMYVFWEFGDSGINNGSFEVIHSYDHNRPGIYKAKLTTKNSIGSTNKTMDIIVGNCSPSADFAVSYPFDYSILLFDQSKYSPTSWRWEFGDGNVSTEQNPFHQYNRVGKQYDVKLTVSNEYGSGIKIQTITASGRNTTVRFTASPTSGPAPMTVRYKVTSEMNTTTLSWDLSDGDTTYWLWDFGDGDMTNATAKDPVHTYNREGIYNVSLTMTIGNVSDTTTMINYITVTASPPHADFTASPRSGSAAPLTVQFTDTSTNSPDGWSWTFGDGDETNATEQNPVHTYHDNGTYTVSLVARNLTGSNTVTKTDYIRVGPVSQYTLINGTYTVVIFNGMGLTTWTPPSGVTKVDYLVVAGGGAGGGGAYGPYNQLLAGGGGGAGGLLQGSNYSVVGKQTVVVGAGGSGGSVVCGLNGANGGNSLFGTLTKNKMAIGGGGGSGPGCGNAGSGGSGGGGNGGVAAGYFFNGTGITGQGYDGGNGCYDSPTNAGSGGGGGGAAEAGALAGPTKGGDGGDGRPIDITGTTTYYGGGGGGGVGSIKANVGDGGAGCGGSGSRGVANDATCQGTGGGGGGAGGGVASNGAGGSGVVIIRYLTPVGPVVSFTASPTKGAAPLTVQFTDTSIGNVSSWRWTFGDNDWTNYSKQNPIHTYHDKGLYTVSLRVNGTDGSKTITKTNYIMVISPPIADFTASPRSSPGTPLTVQFTDTSAGDADYWKWYFGDGNTTNSTKQNPVHTYWNKGLYSVTLKVTNTSTGIYNLTTKMRFINVRRLDKVGVFQPSTHMFYLRNGSVNTSVDYGLSTDIPISGDWNGDGMGDVGVFRPSIHTFYLKNGSANTTVNYGTGTDLPVSGDWNGDGMGDIGVFRPSIHTFYLKNGSTNTTINWGLSTDKPVTGDWNRDGLWDVGVFRNSTHTFYLKNGSTNTTVNYGTGTDLPVSGDWNGDGMGDIGVFRPSIHTFYLKNGSTNTTVNYGSSTDIPITGKWS
jgi:PKD repeat protein